MLDGAHDDHRSAYQQQHQHQQVIKQEHPHLNGNQQHQHQQVVTTNMVLMNHGNSSAQLYSNKQLGAYGSTSPDAFTTTTTLNTQHHLDSIVKSFPTPEMSPLDSPGKTTSHLMYNTTASNNSAYSNTSSLTPPQSGHQQHYYGAGDAISRTPELNGVEHQQHNHAGEREPTDTSAVNQLIASFGDQSSVLKDVQPPYKYRMIVSTTVASTLTDQSIQQQMRAESCNGLTQSQSLTYPNQDQTIDQQQQQRKSHEVSSSAGSRSSPESQDSSPRGTEMTTDEYDRSSCITDPTND